jgi:hypothetical protein
LAPSAFCRTLCHACFCSTSAACMGRSRRSQRMQRRGRVAAAERADLGRVVALELGHLGFLCVGLDNTGW